MNANDFTYLLNNPNVVSEQQVLLLDEIVEEFPYFQSARALQLRDLHNSKSFRYNQALKITAAHTTDRNVLFEFITSEDFPVLEKDNSERIEVAPETIVLEESSLIIESMPEADGIEPESIESIMAKLHSATETQPEANETPEPESIESIMAKFSSTTESKPEDDEITSEPESIESITAKFSSATTTTPEVVDTDESEVLDEVPVEQKIEELQESIESRIEQSILTSIIESTPETIADISRIDETEESPEPTLSKLEQSILTSIIEATPETEKTVELETVAEVSAEGKSVEEKLEIGQPLSFVKAEKHSFQEWLQLASLKPINRTETIETPLVAEKVTKVEVPEDEERKKKLALIDKFIETNPKISSAKNATVTHAVTERPSIDSSYLMTETLAKVYLEQKKYQKAIQAYEILILKYPEKISFFANRIADIKTLQQNNN